MREVLTFDITGGSAVRVGWAALLVGGTKWKTVWNNEEDLKSIKKTVSKNSMTPPDYLREALEKVGNPLMTNDAAKPPMTRVFAPVTRDPCGPDPRRTYAGQPYLERANCSF